MSEEGKTRRDEIEEQALDFHNRNPKVWEMFKRFTFEVIDRGFASYGAMAIFQRIRWETDQADEDGRSTFKLNNNYVPHYARWFILAHPEHKGFFRMRHLISDDKPASSLPELKPSDFQEVEFPF